MLESGFVQEVRRAEERMEKATLSMMKRQHEPMANRELKDWVRCGGGAWTNFSEYGAAWLGNTWLFDAR